jgi:outer membrane autotransporter protein
MVNNGATFDLSGNAGQNVTLLSGGTLNWRQGGTIGGNLDAADALLNFYVPDGTVSGTSLLHVAGNADITGSTVNIALLGTSTPLTAGDHLVLIDAAGTLAGAPTNLTATDVAATATGMQGISLIYTFDLTTTGTQLLASLSSSTPPALNPQTKALPEGYLAGLLLTNQGADLAAGPGLAAAVAEVERGQAYATFATLSGGENRYDTGSHIDLNSSYLMAGIAGTQKLAKSHLTLGLFIEAGEGANRFTDTDRIQGKGEARAVGGGILSRLDLSGTKNGHPYLEGSLRAGRVKSDFKADFGGIVQGTPQPLTHSSYDARSAYQSLHLGGGYLWKQKDTSLDIYAQYLYGRRDSDTVKISGGEKVRFEAIQSHRARIGTRATWTIDKLQPYAGIAYEHEFDGKAKAKVDIGGQRHKIDAPDLKGGTGLLELGLTVKPSATQPLTIDFNLKGYAGKREGFIGGVRAEYRF